MLADLLQELVRLGVQPSGIEREHAERASDLGRHVDENDVLGAAERDREIAPVLADREREDVARIASSVLGGRGREGLGIECHRVSRDERARWGGQGLLCHVYRRRDGLATTTPAAGRPAPPNGGSTRGPVPLAPSGRDTAPPAPPPPRSPPPPRG